MSPRDVERWNRPVTWFWAVGSGLVALLFLWDLVNLEGGRVGNQVVWGRDFINVWTGGKLLNAGQGNLLFDLPAYQEFQRSIFGPLNSHNYSYPPVSYPIAQLLALFTYPVALTIWFAATGALFYHAVKPWWPSRAGPAWLALLTPAALLNIWAGHYGFLVGALFLMGWQRTDDRPIQAGLFFGLMLIKPHMAILVPLVLLLRKKWTVIGSAAATVVSLVTATTLAYGWAAWDGYLFQTSAVQAGMIDAGKAFFGFMSTSFVTAALRLTDSWSLAITGQALLAAFAIGTLTLAARRGVPTTQLGLMTATATFLVLPYAFAYDLTAVAVAAVATISITRRDESQHRWAVYGLVAPSVGILSAICGVPLLSVILAVLFVAQARVALGKPISSPVNHAGAAALV